MAIFDSNFTVIVCFLVIFVIIIIKITKIIIIIIIETIIIIIKKKFGHTRKTSFLTSKKEDQVARIGVRGGGLGDSGNARKKTFFFIDVFPKQRECGIIPKSFSFLKIVQARTISEILLNHIFAKANQKKSF